jgi:hypothetical protein
MAFAFDPNAPSLFGANRNELTVSTLLPVAEEQLEQIAQYNSNDLTQSQQLRLQVHLGNLNELRESLQILITANIDEPKTLERLFKIYETIDMAMSSFPGLDYLAANPTSIPEELTQDSGIEIKEEFPIPEEFGNQASIENSIRVSQMIELFSSEHDENQSPIPLREVDNSEPDFYCPVCTETVPASERFQLSTCNDFYCIHCMKEFVETQINDGKILQICCMNTQCGQQLSESDVERILDSNMFGKYQRFLFVPQNKGGYNPTRLVA